MGQTQEPVPVQLFCGVIYSPRVDMGAVRDGLAAAFGPIDFVSRVFPFDFTGYYRDEMGEGLKKAFYAFEKLIKPDGIVEIKLETNEMERRITAECSGDHTAGGAGRLVNLDPGYLALSKIALATTKDFYHRIYLRDGIYAEVTLNYKKPSFEPYPWTFPDFRTDEYISFFNELRAGYKQKLDSRRY